MCVLTIRHPQDPSEAAQAWPSQLALGERAKSGLRKDNSLLTCPTCPKAMAAFCFFLSFFLNNVLHCGGRNFLIKWSEKVNLLTKKKGRKSYKLFGNDLPLVPLGLMRHVFRDPQGDELALQRHGGSIQ